MKSREKNAEKGEGKAKGKGILRRFADVPTWVNFGYVKDSSTTIFSYLATLFRPRKAEHEESFDEALRRMGTTEQDLTERYQSYRTWMYAFAGLVVILLCYTFFLVFSGSIRGALLGLSVCVLLVVQTYRYSFWCFQIKNRKLGCSFAEWLQGKVDKPSKQELKKKSD